MSPALLAAATAAAADFGTTSVSNVPPDCDGSLVALYTVALSDRTVGAGIDALLLAVFFCGSCRISTLSPGFRPFAGI
jgi:hypothetical protein